MIFCVQFYLVMKGQGKDLEDPSGGGGGAKAFQKKFNKPALNRYSTTIFTNYWKSSRSVDRDFFYSLPNCCPF
jgi:hypothetical protein